MTKKKYVLSAKHRSQLHGCKHRQGIWSKKFDVLSLYCRNCQATIRITVGLDWPKDLNVDLSKEIQSAEGFYMQRAVAP